MIHISVKVSKLQRKKYSKKKNAKRRDDLFLMMTVDRGELVDSDIVEIDRMGVAAVTGEVNNESMIIKDGSKITVEKTNGNMLLEKFNALCLTSNVEKISCV